MAAFLVLQFAGAVFERAGVVAAPDRYLALSLNDAAHLPTEGAPGSVVEFGFTISSTRVAVVEHQPWTVTTSDQIGPPLLAARGTATVGPGAHVTVPVHVVMPESTGIVTVAIGAPGQRMAPLQWRIQVGPTPGAR